MVLLNTAFPKLAFPIAAQKSPPLSLRSCVLGFDRSQSGVKLPLASVQDRVTLDPAMREVGIWSPKFEPVIVDSRYRPRLALSAVLPSPNIS